MIGRTASFVVTLGAAALGTLSAAKAQSTIDTFHVQGNVYMLVGAGPNVAVQIGDEGVLVVDTGTRASREQLLAAIRGLSDKPIRWIINTSSDADHTGGNETISQAGQTVNGNPAAIIAHENVLARMTAENRPVTELPLNTFFEDGRDFSFNGEAVFLYHVPSAHTDGDIVVYFRGSDVLVAGDVFVTTSYPVIDIPGGGSYKGIVAALERLVDMIIPVYGQDGGTLVIPGHGRLSNLGDVLNFREMVIVVRDRLQNMIDAGMTLEQVKAAKPTFDYDPVYGATEGFWTTDKFIEAAYQSLSQKTEDKK